MIEGQRLTNNHTYIHSYFGWYRGYRAALVRRREQRSHKIEKLAIQEHANSVRKAQLARQLTLATRNDLSKPLPTTLGRRITVRQRSLPTLERSSTNHLLSSRLCLKKQNTMQSFKSIKVSHHLSTTQARRRNRVVLLHDGAVGDVRCRVEGDDSDDETNCQQRQSFQVVIPSLVHNTQDQRMCRASHGRQTQPSVRMQGPNQTSRFGATPRVLPPGAPPLLSKHPVPESGVRLEPPSFNRSVVLRHTCGLEKAWDAPQSDDDVELLKLQPSEPAMTQARLAPPNRRTGMAPPTRMAPRPRPRMAPGLLPRMAPATPKMRPPLVETQPQVEYTPSEVTDVQTFVAPRASDEKEEAANTMIASYQGWKVRTELRREKAAAIKIGAAARRRQAAKVMRAARAELTSNALKQNTLNLWQRIKDHAREEHQLVGFIAPYMLPISPKALHTSPISPISPNALLIFPFSPAALPQAGG